MTPPAGQPFYLWGDFLGTNSFAVRLPDGGKPLIYTTTMMPGQKIRFQVFDGLSLHTRLLTGDKVVSGFATETIPSADTVLRLRADKAGGAVAKTDSGNTYPPLEGGSKTRSVLGEG